MFGWLKKRNRGEAMHHAANQLAQHLASFCGGPLADDFLRRIDKDPYSAGYLDGKTGTFLFTALQEGSTSREELAKDYGGALVLALDSVLGEEGSRAYVASTLKHRNERSQKYLEGQKNGLTIARYYMRLADVSTDPDFSRALQVGRKTADRAQSIGVITGRISDNEAALIGLEELWYRGRSA